MTSDELLCLVFVFVCMGMAVGCGSAVQRVLAKIGEIGKIGKIGKMVE